MNSPSYGVVRGLARGAAAGAAGTTALNAATYADMALRGRGTSSAPQDVVEKGAHAAGVDIPGKGDTRDNRLAGLGPLSGIAVGVAVGALAGLASGVLKQRTRPVTFALATLLTGGAAMALADVPLKALHISDPADWRAQDWAADAIPHLVYGVVTASTLAATE